MADRTPEPVESCAFTPLGGHRIILLGLAGSRAYGLDTPESDEDWRGVFVYPTRKILGIGKFRGPETVDDKAHECVLHEVEKFVRLAAAGNPSILEQLFLDEYKVFTHEGRLLIEAREAFLSQKVRQTYGGYAVQQAKKLALREEQGMEGWGPALKKRREKHGRHLARLLLQGQELLGKGTLTVRLTEAQRREAFAVGEMDTYDVGTYFRAEMDRMDAIKSCLPEEPDWERINDVLLAIRYWNP